MSSSERLKLPATVPSVRYVHLEARLYDGTGLCNIWGKSFSRVEGVGSFSSLLYLQIFYAGSAFIRVEMMLEPTQITTLYFG